MVEILRPADAAQVGELLRWAAAEEKPIEIVGRGTKRAFGRPVETGHRLDLSGLSGIDLYEPAELVLTARAGTPLREIEAALDDAGQELAFEPADLGPILGGKAGEQTLGGVIACNLAGPRRIKAGAARDHFLGFSAISGRAETFKSGGRVMKNVTGYDLSKLMAGSFGTLAVMTEITVKVLPKAETETTLMLAGLDERTAIAALNEAAGTPQDVSSLAHLPAPVAARSAVKVVAGAGDAVTLLRLEGPAPSVAERARVLTERLGRLGAIEAVRDKDSRSLWREVRDVAGLLTPSQGRAVWRISTPPTSGAAVASAIAGATGGPVEYYYDWAGGLIWLAVDEGDDADAHTVRGAVAAHGGGHATLVRASADARRRVPVFEPRPTPLAALERRVKESFDPRHILNPGRMAPEIETQSQAEVETKAEAGS